MKSEAYGIEYVIISAMGREITKRIMTKSKEKKDEILAEAKAKGIKVNKCVKLYPFSTEKNQHNFELIRNICFNRMHDMESGEIPWDGQEYDRLEELREKAGEYWCLPLPLAWLPYNELKEARELAQMAIIHRQNACIEAGRPDLIAYC